MRREDAKAWEHCMLPWGTDACAGTEEADACERSQGSVARPPRSQKLLVIDHGMLER